MDITNKTVSGETVAQNDKCDEDVSVVLKLSHSWWFRGPPGVSPQYKYTQWCWYKALY